MTKQPKPRVLLITEDFPSGLSGNSVKTRHALDYLLSQGWVVDLCCFHFDKFKVHPLKHANLHVTTVVTSRNKKLSPAYFFHILTSVLAIAPITMRRLYNHQLATKIAQLVKKHRHQVVFFDGYSTLQYLKTEFGGQKIYWDDEDYTDLFKQRLQQSPNWWQKLFLGQEYLKSLVFERLQFRKLDQIWAICPNNQKRFRKISGVKTVLSPTVIPVQKKIYRGQGNNLVFTGTLNWPENIDGLKWFLENHWPAILKQLPDLTLIVIGQGAEENFIEYLKAQPNLNYLGYVSDLSADFRRADLAISPVRINAGIKVKTLTYLSYGLPVVSSVIAAWGLVSTGGVAVVSDQNFGKMVVALMKRPDLRKSLSRLGLKNIKKNYAASRWGSFLKTNLLLSQFK